MHALYFFFFGILTAHHKFLLDYIIYYEWDGRLDS